MRLVAFLSALTHDKLAISEPSLLPFAQANTWLQKTTKGDDNTESNVLDGYFKSTWFFLRLKYG